MLYALHEMQHALLAPLECLGENSPRAVFPPLQPARICPGRKARGGLRGPDASPDQALRQARVRARPHGDRRRGGGGRRARRRGQAVLPPAAFQKRRARAADGGAARRAALGPLRHAAAATRCARCSPTTTSGSPTGSTRRRCRSPWARSTSTTTSTTCASSSASWAPERPRDLGVPADGAGARGGLAHGGGGDRSRARSHDGRADRRAPQPDRGQQLRQRSARSRGSRRT